MPNSPEKIIQENLDNEKLQPRLSYGTISLELVQHSIWVSRRITPKKTPNL